MIEFRPYQTKAIQETFEVLKKNDDPVLLECSVGGGKSYLIGGIAKRLQDLNKRVLCLVNSSELVRNNSQAFKEMGGSPSVFCASLSKKEYENNVIFATPQSVMSALKRNHPISNIIFNMIIVDEAHGINYNQQTSTFMQIFRHYKQSYKDMRLLGMTGTAFRADMSIVGEHALFKTKTGNLSTAWLIENGYLTKPAFGISHTESFDFSHVRLKSDGNFDNKELQAVLDNKKRLTWEILQEVQVIMQNRKVCMVFCSTRLHCYEALAALPKDEARIILGTTPDKERDEILTGARNLKIKYLISINCLLTGVNITALDCIVWIRPTSSLLLFIQGIGRGLRLHEGKKDCLVMDYAGNLERFGHIDDIIINEAIQPKESDNEEDYPIMCYTCSTSNSLFCRRCRGIIDGKRCEHFFEWRDCQSCGVRNDQCARSCRSCQAELIDPNAKLKKHIATVELPIHTAEYWVMAQKGGFPIINARYFGYKNNFHECFCTNTQKARNICYASFIRKHVKNASDYYMKMSDYRSMELMLKTGLKTPSSVVVIDNMDGTYKMVKKIFQNDI